MTTRLISDALGQISDRYLEEAAVDRAPRKPTDWRKWCAAAACLGLVLTGLLIALPTAPPTPQPTEITLTADGVFIPPKSVSLSAKVALDMPAFFIYGGRLYEQYEWLDDAQSLVGDHLGTATGLINEWTPRDGYVELAGSVKGDFYAVRGYDPSFMLCMAYDGGKISTYVCNTGITLKTGADLFADRLNLAEHYRALRYETRMSWNGERGQQYRHNDPHSPLLDAWLDALMAAEFLPWKEAVAAEGHTMSSIYDTECYHLYFEMENGTTVHLRLYDGGYVRFQGILDVCVKLPDEVHRALIDHLDARTDATPIDA